MSSCRCSSPTEQPQRKTRSAQKRKDSRQAQAVYHIEKHKIHGDVYVFDIDRRYPGKEKIFMDESGITAVTSHPHKFLYHRIGCQATFYVTKILGVVEKNGKLGIKIHVFSSNPEGSMEREETCWAPEDINDESFYCIEGKTRY
ncbi:hypothetical protein KKG38_04540 [Patescibacteria group bacterium]|nr:hypothetical protein [Patescibacteria group bacterium]